MVDYSKWDALELSDDSDFEEHPNVDKKSFIRAKQAQIHQQRLQRKQQIETFKYERIVNDGLLLWIGKLYDALEAEKDSTKKADEVVLQALVDTTIGLDAKVPPRPPGVHSGERENPTYPEMMATLVDMVKKDVDTSKTTDRRQGFLDGIKMHKEKVENLQDQLDTKLAELEQEEGRKITSDKLTEGFSYSSINKAKEPAPKKGSTKSANVELLNPGAQSIPVENISSGAEADIEDGSSEDQGLQPTALGREFGKIKIGNYEASKRFILTHPDVVKEQESDGLLMDAFNYQLEGKEQAAKQAVHQSLMIQYVQQLGRSGIDPFFNRLSIKSHQARNVFLDDVEKTYQKVQTRAAAMNEEKEEGGGVEQIQLHAVDPGTTINIVIPQPNSEEPAEQEARKVFESFPPGLQRALETGSLDEVNVVLGKMSVDEAEEVVKQLGDGGMLSLEEEIIDATTEEGRAKVKELETAAAEEAVGESAEDPEIEAVDSRDVVD